MSTTNFKGDSPPIRKESDLCSIFLRGEKPRSSWGVGTEHEKFGFLSNNSRLPYHGTKNQAGINILLEKLADKSIGQAVYEGKHPIALKRKDGSFITLEPGGQFELSGLVQPDTYHTCHEMGEHLKEIQGISAELGLGWLTIGRIPFVHEADSPWVPKERYAIMRKYLSTRGSMALDMMQHTCTVQVNLDYSDESDMGRKLRLMLLLTPLVTALFAASPFVDGKPCGRLSERAWIWEHVDSHRGGFIKRALHADFGYADYVQYALDVPMFFIQRQGRHLDCSGLSFRAFLEHGMQGEQALEEDWEMHLTTIFPHARLKQFIEWRPADMGLPSMVCVLTALSRGLFYESHALSALEDLVAEWPPTDMDALQHQAIVKGLEAQLLKRPLRAWGREVLDIAAGGLQRLGIRRLGIRRLGIRRLGIRRLGSEPLQADERGYLNPLWEVIEERSQAERLLDLWHGAWKQDINGIFNSDFFVNNHASSQQLIASLDAVPPEMSNLRRQT